MSRMALAGFGLAAALSGNSVVAQQPAAVPPRNDYSDGSNWLCRPGRKAGDKDACNVDLSATVVAADGAVGVRIQSTFSKAVTKSRAIRVRTRCAFK